MKKKTDKNKGSEETDCRGNVGFRRAQANEEKEARDMKRIIENATEEMFLSEYYSVKSVLGKHLTEEKKLFTALSEICLIPEKKVGKLYNLAENDTARGINSVNEFYRHQRILEYSKLNGVPQKVNAEWEEAVKIKGNAIVSANGYHLVPEADATGNVVYNCLSTAATGGNVLALRIMGILQCEGIFFVKNRAEGLKSLCKAADWNDCVSVLALLRYSEEKRGYNMARLKGVTEHTPFARLYGAAAEKYKTVSSADVREVGLLYKAFGAGVLKSDCYDPQYARILNSKALHAKDKEKAVFSPNKELVSVIGDLPLKLSPENVTSVSTDGVERISVKREEENAAIVRALGNCDLRAMDTYRPLCICSDSRYVLNMYAKAIAEESKNTHVEVIEVADLVDYDLEPSPNNIFVRGIDEDKDNRILLFFCGQISQRKAEAVRSMLQSARRANFHLNSPNVTLDLSAVLPICFCDRENAQFLRTHCDIVRLEQFMKEELSLAVKDMLACKAKLYGVEKIEICGEIGEVFRGYDIDAAEKLVDAVIRARRTDGCGIVLSREIIEEYAPRNDSPRIGFGGFTNGRN